MFKSFIKYLYFILFLFPSVSFAQDSTLIKVQQKMDEQEKAQKEVIYSYNTISYVHKLDKHGVIEKTDTIKTWYKFKGDSLQEYTLLYSSDKKKEKTEGKKGRSESAKLPKLDDPAYDFQVDQASGKISFAPKKPKKGDLTGELLYDPQDMTIKQINATIPKLKWPVKEFKMEMKFIQTEGFLFPLEFRMLAAWNALISKGRIRVESSNSDYKIYK